MSDFIEQAENALFECSKCGMSAGIKLRQAITEVRARDQQIDLSDLTEEQLRKWRVEY